MLLRFEAERTTIEVEEVTERTRPRDELVAFSRARDGVPCAHTGSLCPMLALDAVNEALLAVVPATRSRSVEDEEVSMEKLLGSVPR
jgi:hypothetical protein